MATYDWPLDRREMQWRMHQLSAQEREAQEQEIIAMAASQRAQMTHIAQLEGERLSAKQFECNRIASPGRTGQPAGSRTASPGRMAPPAYSRAYGPAPLHAQPCDHLLGAWAVLLVAFVAAVSIMCSGSSAVDQQENEPRLELVFTLPQVSGLSVGLREVGPSAIVQPTYFAEKPERVIPSVLSATWLEDGDRHLFASPSTPLSEVHSNQRDEQPVRSFLNERTALRMQGDDAASSDGPNTNDMATSVLHDPAASSEAVSTSPWAACLGLPLLLELSLPAGLLSCLAGVGLLVVACWALTRSTLWGGWKMTLVVGPAIAPQAVQAAVLAPDAADAQVLAPVLPSVDTQRRKRLRILGCDHGPQAVPVIELSSSSEDSNAVHEIVAAAADEPGVFPMQAAPQTVRRRRQWASGLFGSPMEAQESSGGKACSLDGIKKTRQSRVSSPKPRKPPPNMYLTAAGEPREFKMSRLRERAEREYLISIVDAADNEEANTGRREACGGG